jgi:hypothetical protein
MAGTTEHMTQPSNCSSTTTTTTTTSHGNFHPKKQLPQTLYPMWNLTTHKNAKKYTHNTYKMQLHICVWVLKWWEISLYVSTTGFVVIRMWSYGLKLYNLLENGLVWRDWNKTSQTTDKTDTPIKKEISRTVVIMRQVIAVLMVFCVVIPCRLVGGYQCFKRK